MSGQLRKLLDSVPAQYMPGVGTQQKYVDGPDGSVQRIQVRGASPAGVATSATDLASRADAALQTYKDARAAKKGVNVAIKPLDELADLVRNVAETHAREPDTVTANVAAALLALDPDDRMLVLRRANRPALFEPLLDSGLPQVDPLPGGLGTQSQSQQKRDRKALKQIAKNQAQTRRDLPAVQRPSSMLVSPDRETARGNVIPSSKTFKDHIPKEGSSPLEVQVRRGDRGGSGGLTDEDIEEWGMEEGSKKARKFAQNRLAGDQISQAKAVEKKFGFARLPNVTKQTSNIKEAIKSIVRESGVKRPRGITLTGIIEALRKGKEDLSDSGRAASNWIDLQPHEFRMDLSNAAMPEPPPPPDQVVKRGTSQARGGRWKGGKSLEIEQEVARRNRSMFQKVLEPLYEATRPKAELMGTGSNAAMRANHQSDAIINIDKMFPWWRARFATLDSRGRYTYPQALPSAEFVTGMIKGLFNVEDPDFETRMLPLIQRSIAAAPDEPSTSRAAGYSNKVFLLSPTMEKAMRAGVGSPDYPYAVYGDRKVPRPKVKKPARTIAEQRREAAAADTESEKAARASVKQMMKSGGKKTAKEGDSERSAMEKVQRLMRGRDEPGTNETSSIYMVPAQSPLRLLIA